MFASHKPPSLEPRQECSRKDAPNLQSPCEKLIFAASPTYPTLLSSLFLLCRDTRVKHECCASSNRFRQSPSSLSPNPIFFESSEC